jgi:hypothetical protein
VAAAARIAGLSSTSLHRRFAGGELPGYHLGRRWFVPEREFRRHLRRRSWMLQHEATDDMVRELTEGLPGLVTMDDLERFFGLRRPFLYDLLRLPVFAGAPGRDGVTTIVVLEEALRAARNGCPPCVADVREQHPARVA